MEYTCPDCQKNFKETSTLEDFISACPHCGMAVGIPADAAMVERARIEAEKKQQADRKEAEQKALQENLRKQEAEDAQAVALMRRSVKRICPHCLHDGTWWVIVKPGVESFIVQCKEYNCQKKLTILNASDELVTPLADIHLELETIRYRFGVLLVCLFVIPVIVGIIVAILRG